MVDRLLIYNISSQFLAILSRLLFTVLLRGLCVVISDVVILIGIFFGS